MDKQQTITPELQAILGKLSKDQLCAKIADLMVEKKKVLDMVIFTGENRDFSLITVDMEQHHIDRAQADLDSSPTNSAQMHIVGSQANEAQMRKDPKTGLPAITHFNTNKDRDGNTVDRIEFFSELVKRNPKSTAFRIASKRERPVVEESARKAS